MAVNTGYNGFKENTTINITGEQEIGSVFINNGQAWIVNGAGVGAYIGHTAQYKGLLCNIKAGRAV